MACAFSTETDTPIPLSLLPSGSTITCVPGPIFISSTSSVTHTSTSFKPSTPVPIETFSPTDQPKSSTSRTVETPTLASNTTPSGTPTQTATKQSPSSSQTTPIQQIITMSTVLVTDTISAQPSPQPSATVLSQTSTRTPAGLSTAGTVGIVLGVTLTSLGILIALWFRWRRRSQRGAEHARAFPSPPLDTQPHFNPGVLLTKARSGGQFALPTPRGDEEKRVVSSVFPQVLHPQQAASPAGESSALHRDYSGGSGLHGAEIHALPHTAGPNVQNQFRGSVTDSDPPPEYAEAGMHHRTVKS